MRATGPYWRPWSGRRSPGSRARSVRTCQCLRPRRVRRVLALARPSVLPSTIGTVSAPRTQLLSRLNGWPVRSPTDASPTPSRLPAHGSGPMWLAIPSSQWTCTISSLPVSRRTPKQFPVLGAQGGRAAALLLTCVARHTAHGAPCIASRPAPPKRELIPCHILTCPAATTRPTRPPRPTRAHSRPSPTVPRSSCRAAKRTGPIARSNA
jgi:hypothetical protein